MAGTAARDQRPLRIGFVEIAGDGAMAGLYGASAVAVWFLIVDSLTREALFTPSLVGTAVLRGAGAGPASEIDLFAVAVYTVIHCLLFIAFGVACAWLLARLEHTPDFPLIAIGVFVPLEIGFVVGTRLLLPGAAETVGHFYIVTSNALAALLMAFYLRYGQRHPDDSSAP